MRLHDGPSFHNLTSKHWISEEIKAMILQKNIAFKRYLVTKTATEHKIYKSIRNQVNAKIKRAKSEYTQKCFDEIDSSKKKWDFTNNLLQRKK